MSLDLLSSSWLAVVCGGGGGGWVGCGVGLYPHTPAQPPVPQYVE